MEKTDIFQIAMIFLLVQVIVGTGIAYAIWRAYDVSLDKLKVFVKSVIYLARRNLAGAAPIQKFSAVAGPDGFVYVLLLSPNKYLLTRAIGGNPPQVVAEEEFEEVPQVILEWRLREIANDRTMIQAAKMQTT